MKITINPFSAGEMKFNFQLENKLRIGNQKNASEIVTHIAIAQVTLQFYGVYRVDRVDWLSFRFCQVQ